MPLTRKTTGVEKTKRETGSIDKVRINDGRVQVLTSEGKIYVFDKREVCTVTNISLSVNERPVNASFENSWDIDQCYPFSEIPDSGICQSCAGNGEELYEVNIDGVRPGSV